MKHCTILLALSGFACVGPVVADQPASGEVQWKLSEDFRGGADKENPNADAREYPTWHFLRTTRSDGPIETRRWLRDGRYVPLGEKGEKLFGLPFDGWIFRCAANAESPVVSRATEEKAAGLSVKRGDLVVAPGPEHATVIGWRSPAAGQLEIQGSFEHVQASSGVVWYVERGPAPDVERGFAPLSLATGRLVFGTAAQKGEFHIQDQSVQAGEYVYFIVDAQADGTGSPHSGDGTRFDVTLTIRDARFPSPPVPPSFEKDIRPILAQRCHKCHGADLQEAKLDLRTLSTMLQGGESGPAVVPGNPDGSLLVDLLARGQMPPGDGEKPSAGELALIRRWVKARTPADEKIVSLPPRTHVSAEDRQFWAFQSPKKVGIPIVNQADRVRTPIDAFLLARLEAEGLTFSAEADHATLIRRAYFDLVGLPPSTEAVTAFLDDTRPDAYEHLIDELLASRHYGERWGRHWLDAAGYVDNRLFDGDLATIYPNEGIWRYRDYVIKAFNDDKPYDRFLTEQLAGDELVAWRRAESFTPETLELLAATGYLRSVEDHTSEPQYGIDKRYEVIFGAMETFSTSVLGLTMECCRCHNHKYDPLPQRDYYRLMACFEPAFNVHDWKKPQERFLADVAPVERAGIDSHNAQIDKQVAELQPQLKAAEEAKDDARIADLKSQIAALQAKRRSYGKVQALWDVGPPPISRVMRRGNVNALGVLVQAGYPEVLQTTGESSPDTTVAATSETSERRLTLARWLTRVDHPLTGRVIVNRVWHHHFGHGIVATLGNFGRSGSPPTHSELLDWLTVDLVENGWSIKRLHRQIMLSSAYRQSSRRAPAAAVAELATVQRPAPESLNSGEFSYAENGEQIDPDNLLLWRMNLRRLEAEVIRDSILAVSGELDRTAGGPPVELTTPPDGLSLAKAAPTPTSAQRRSVYLFARRVYPLKFLELFDSPIMPVNCTQRTGSATVLQSLALLNSEFLFEQADRMAGRVVASAGTEPAAQVRLAFQFAFARAPRESEMTQCLAFLSDQTGIYVSGKSAPEQAARTALADLCHLLLSTNEFLYAE